MRRKAVSYLRVSTERQGQSGLGLEAQRSAVSGFLNGGSWDLLAEYVEIESGKRSDRPRLREALDHCRATGATLVIAKLDRLARNVEFIARLMNGGVDFVAADMPEANRLTIHILAAVAEHEREAISQRTKAALAAAKARGAKLGNPNGAQHLRQYGNEAAVKARQALAKSRAASLCGIVSDIRASGLTSVRAIAAELNRRGVQAPRGGRWHVTTTYRLLQTIDQGA